MGNHTRVDHDGKSLSLVHTSSDSPILPAEQIKTLHSLDPKYVDWILLQTEKEAEHRRKQESRINKFVFAERVGGLLCAAAIALSGLVIGGYAIISGHDVAGTTICSGFLVALVGLFLRGKRMSRKQDEQPDEVKKTSKQLKK